MQIAARSPSFAYPSQRASMAPQEEIGAEEAKPDRKGMERDQVHAQADPQVQQEVKRLQARDMEVRTHEMAHLTAAAGLAVSGPHYTMTTGPDGKAYVTGGHVQIDTSPAGDPEATVDKARRIRAAALAPAQPSAADMAVAAKASQMEAQAQAEVRAEEQGATTGQDRDKDTGDALAALAPAVAAARGVVAEAVVEGEAAGTDRTAGADDGRVSRSASPPAESDHSMDPAHLAQCPECQRKAFMHGMKAPPRPVLLGYG